MVFFERSEEEQAKGFAKLLSNKDNLMLLCLLGDFLFLLKVFQKKLQGDDVIIVDIVPETKKFIAKIDKLHQRPVLGGWEDKFLQSYDEENGTFFGRVLWQKERRASRRNFYVSETRAFSAIKVEVLQSLRNFMETRLKIDDHAKENVSSFVKFTAREADIRDIHASVAPDLDLRYLAQEYEDVQESTMHKGNPKALLQNLCANSNKTETLTEVLARILVCKPHSADCERLVSACNTIKTNSRNRLERETISNYLYVNINMPVLSKFDPRPAVRHFIDERRRRVKDTPKADRQAWFQKVFQRDDTDESDVEDADNATKQRKLNREF
jgi:type IV secretory pathway VirB4 component